MRTSIVLAVAALLAVGCSARDTELAAPSPATVPAALVTTVPAATPPVPPTKAPTKAPTRTPTRTAAPVTVDGPCPYADAELMAGTVGQRIERVTVTRTRPHVGCAFYRPNGEKAADVAVSVLASAAAARAQAVRVPGRTANPVEVGDGGAVAITDGGAVLAVSKGAALVVVRINQRISLEAVEIAKLVVARL